MNHTPVSRPSRAAALDQLTRFVPKAAQDYARGRNTDEGPDRPGAVSRLSACLRYRLITEEEVVATVIAAHGPAAAEKFVQEVLWRTYWKGWLEMRPAVWSRFIEERNRHRHECLGARSLADAESGGTGIEGFDDWARELVATGYLHNHARMWFASIWIFTLRLPWTLGADFFLRHLIDADAASNTLSWRWVAGLQTVGKTYLATADNIARHTNGRYSPRGLAREAVALSEPPMEAARALPDVESSAADSPSMLLVTHEDMHPESVIPGNARIAAAWVTAGSESLWGDAARQFVGAATSDAAARAGQHFQCAVDVSPRLDAPALIAAARTAGVRRIVTAHAPVGPVADALAHLAPLLASEGLALTRIRRSWDTRSWPHATKGFFAFKEQMAALASGGTSLSAVDP